MSQRVLYFSRDYTTHDRRFLQKLAQSPYEIHFAHFGSGNVVFEQRALPDGVRHVNWIGAQRRVSNTEDALALMPAYEQLLADLKPDLVHAGPVQSCGWMTALADFHPHVLMSWGSDILVESDRSEAMRWITRDALRGADGFVCDCDTVRAKADVIAPLAGKVIAQFAWGIDLASFPLRDFSRASSDVFNVLSTRSFEKLYGVEALVAGFCRAWRQMSHLRLTMLGDGSLRDSIRAIAHQYGADKAVELHGMIPHDQQPQYFANADVYLSCAHSDGTSISLLEAMATGLPVIVTDIPSNREWVTPDVNGWLAPAGDIRRIEQAILRAATQNQQARQAMSARNRAVAESRANWDTNFEKLIEAYQELL